VAGGVALSGDLVGAVEAFKAAAPALVLPAKFVVAFPLVYHYLGGVRHVIWDKAHYGNMARPAPRAARPAAAGALARVTRRAAPPTPRSQLCMPPSHCPSRASGAPALVRSASLQAVARLRRVDKGCLGREVSLQEFEAPSLRSVRVGVADAPRGARRPRRTAHWRTRW
jgi:hypothetical protein